VKTFSVHVSARSVNYRPHAAELIVPPGLTASSSASSAALNSTPNGITVNYKFTYKLHQIFTISWLS